MGFYMNDDPMYEEDVELIEMGLERAIELLSDLAIELLSDLVPEEGSALFNLLVELNCGYKKYLGTKHVN